MVENITTGDWGLIQVGRSTDARGITIMTNWNDAHTVPYTKYEIKESDFRVKTASFTTPQWIDLTNGLYLVRIVSKYHENFAGIILECEDDEENGLYTYQCQDWSRQYMTAGRWAQQNRKLYNVLRALITRGGISAYSNPTKAQLNAYKTILSGLRPLAKYNQKLYTGNIYGGNPFNQNVSFIAEGKPIIEIIRDLVYSSLGFFDVYFNDHGVLQIEPISKVKWENTGLHLGNDFSERKFKFSTTNTISRVVVKGEGVYPQGTKSTPLYSKDLIGLDLSAFFGFMSTAIDDPNKSSSTKTTTNAVTNTNNKNTTTTTNKTSNPYGNKKKKIWIGADGGSGGFAKEIISLLQKNGWSCHYSGEGSEVHYWDFFNVTSDYQVLAIVDNGFDPACVTEVYGAGSPKNALAKKNVTYCFMFDTRSWTGGMSPYRYGNFKGYCSGRAPDDGYSNFSGCLNVDNYFRKHKAAYCASPSAKGIVDQFLAGGYYKYKGIQV